MITHCLEQQKFLARTQIVVTKKNQIVIIQRLSYSNIIQLCLKLHICAQFVKHTGKTNLVFFWIKVKNLIGKKYYPYYYINKIHYRWLTKVKIILMMKN